MYLFWLVKNNNCADPNANIAPKVSKANKKLILCFNFSNYAG